MCTLGGGRQGEGEGRVRDTPGKSLLGANDLGDLRFGDNFLDTATKTRSMKEKN